MSLKEKLTEFGFESNESYEHVVKCFLDAPNKYVRFLNIDGDDGRHKTVFAYALAQALGSAHVHYYEFGIDEPVQPQIVRVVNDEEQVSEPVIASLDRALNEVCALSEAEKVVLILDQLQFAEYKQHIRLAEFAKDAEWNYGDVKCYANKENLRVFLVSDDGVSAMLQQYSFRIWLPKIGVAIKVLNPADFGLDESDTAWLALLVKLMDELNVSPLFSEYKKLIYDIEAYICNENQLMESILGRVSNIYYSQLNSDKLKLLLKSVMQSYENNLKIDESIEMEGDLKQ